MSTVAFELRAKIDCLSRTETFPDRPPAVETIETHFAWVFLAGQFAYKLKKPLRFHDFDFTALATRRVDCELEVALNRRLAPAVYVGTIPLCADGTRLSLAGPGIPVEWLVKMQHLPRERAFDRLAAAGQLADEHLCTLLGTLVRFYANAARAPWDGPAYHGALVAEIEQTAEELATPALALDVTRVRLIATALTKQIAASAGALHARVADKRVVDAHGDLRPEHIFMTPEPQIIDCLEFYGELRLLDSAAEVAFLALECERLGQAELAHRLLALYRQQARDDIDSDLLTLYRQVRAFARAKLAAWHLHDQLDPAATAHWQQRTRWYLDVAATSLARDTARVRPSTCV